LFALITKDCHCAKPRVIVSPSEECLEQMKKGKDDFDAIFKNRKPFPRFDLKILANEVVKVRFALHNHSIWRHVSINIVTPNDVSENAEGTATSNSVKRLENLGQLESSKSETIKTANDETLRTVKSQNEGTMVLLGTIKSEDENALLQRTTSIDFNSNEDLANELSPIRIRGHGPRMQLIVA
jgi:hypothetical protein